MTTNTMFWTLSFLALWSVSGYLTAVFMLMACIRDEQHWRMIEQWFEAHPLVRGLVFLLAGPITWIQVAFISIMQALEEDNTNDAE